MGPLLVRQREMIPPPPTEIHIHGHTTFSQVLARLYRLSIWEEKTH